MNKRSVRFSYESCLDALARLSAYATSRPFLGAVEVNERQDDLATNDLISFCVHARRLIDGMGLKNSLGQTLIKSHDLKDWPIFKILGCLIHHDDLVIIRCQTRVRMLNARLESKTGEEFWQKVEPELKKKSNSEPTSPIILFKSDQIPYTIISLQHLTEIFVQNIIPEIVKAGLDNGLCLIDDPFKDLDVLSPEASNILSRIRK